MQMESNLLPAAFQIRTPLCYASQCYALPSRVEAYSEKQLMLGRSRYTFAAWRQEQCVDAPRAGHAGGALKMEGRRRATDNGSRNKTDIINGAFCNCCPAGGIRIHTGYHPRRAKGGDLPAEHDSRQRGWEGGQPPDLLARAFEEGVECSG